MIVQSMVEMSSRVSVTTGPVHGVLQPRGGRGSVGHDRTHDPHIAFYISKAKIEIKHLHKRIPCLDCDTNEFIIFIFGLISDH